MTFHYDIVSIMTFTPLVGALLLVFMRNFETKNLRRVAFAASLAPMAFMIQILRHYRPDISEVQFSNKLPWIPALQVDYFVGVDGLSIAMLLLVSILTPLTILGASRWIENSQQNQANYMPFYALILLEQTGLYGAFTALNFFHWFIFWEASLIPMFFLIKLYGGEDRTHAAYQFFVYTFIGSVAILIGMQFVYLATGSWDFIDLVSRARNILPETGKSQLVSEVEKFAGTLQMEFIIDHSMTLIFFLVLFGFAVKVPMWPFHTWLPLTYTQAPMAGSMLLTGLMSKLGVYGFLRIVLPLFGSTAAPFASAFLVLAVATILFGALAAMVQRDLKTLVAYSSINHLGYCLLGIFAVMSISGNVDDRAMALNGVIVQMFAHGLSAVGLFYFVGLIEQRTQTREIATFGGLRKTLPVLSGLLGIILFASLGLPGLGGFVGEFMIFRGAFPLATSLTAIAVGGILFTAIYLLKFLGDVFFGPPQEKWKVLPDLNWQESLISGVLVSLLLVVGIAPAPLIQLSNSVVTQLARYFS